MKKVILFLLCTFCLSTAIALIGCACMINHEHYFTQKVATVRYLASDVTCTQSATYYYSCKCGKKDTDTFEYGAPLGHDFSDWQVVTQPTETEDGLKTRECMRKGCGYTESKNIKSHTHSFTEQIITDEFLASSATCVNKAMYYYSCACGEKSENIFEYGEPLGHDYVNDLCTHCGEKIPTEGLEYSLESDRRSYSCTGLGSATETDIVIASLYNGLPVISIENRAFYGCRQITSITIPNSVIRIESNAFSYCTGLESIVVSSGNKKFHSANNCLIKTESKTLVKGCKNSIIPMDGSVTSIGFLAFHACYGLTSITIPDTVTLIDIAAFQDCVNLKQIILSESVAEIGYGAFVGCAELEKIVVSSENKKYHSTGNCLIETTSKTLVKGFNDGIIPDDGSVTVIGHGAFHSCYGLKSIIIPDSVTSIEYGAFYNCNSLTSIILPDSMTSIGDWAFYDCDGLTSIILPDSIVSIGYQAFYDCSSLTSITIPNNVVSIGALAFEFCRNLQYNFYGNAKYLGNENNPYLALISATDTTITSCDINPNTKVIANNSFSKCEALTSITIPDSVISIGDSAFLSCSNLTSITISDSVTSIGNYTFSHCSNLTSITIPDSVISIGNYAFSYCSSLTSITIPDSVTSIGDSAFLSCSNLTSITISDSVTSIGDFTFSHCFNLTSITIPDSVISIGSSAFANCSNLTSITIPDSVTLIGSMAFYNCSNLTSITIPDSVTSIGNFAFSNCSNLTSITIPDSVISIGDWAFSHCSNLTSITIGNSVTSIGNYAFYECRSLMSVTFKNTNGWKVSNNRNTQTLQSSSLSNVYTAARYLTLDYYGYTWERG